MTDVYAYVRVSTEKQGEEGVSLEEQREAIRQYADKNELHVVEWFEERETAAKRGRPEFSRMLQLLQQEEADGLVVHKVDRSARNLKDWAEIGELIDEGIEVHFAGESLDLSSRGGRLSADIQAVVAADYIRNLSEEVKKGLYGRLRQGIYPFRAPIGYHDTGGGNPKQVDPVQGPLVRKAFQLYATGRHSLKTLGQKMHKLGLRNRNGGRVSRNGLSTMLNNPFYYGLIRIKKTGQTFDGVHEPLISKRLFDRVQEVLEGKTPNRTTKHNFLFRKLFTGTHCGYSLIGEKQKGYIYYRCHTSGCPTKCLREETLDQTIQKKLQPLRLTPQEREHAEEKIRELRDSWESNREEEFQALELQLGQIDSRLDRLTDAYLDQVIGKDEFKRRKRSLLEEKHEIKEQQHAVKDGAGERLADRVEEFLEFATTAKPSYESALKEEKREIIRKVTSNRGAKGKKPIVKLDEPFRLLAERGSVINGADQHDAPRTFEAVFVSLAQYTAKKHNMELPKASF